MYPGLAIGDREPPECVRVTYGNRSPAAGQPLLPGGCSHAAEETGRDEPEMAPFEGQEYGDQVSNHRLFNRFYLYRFYLFIYVLLDVFIYAKF